MTPPGDARHSARGCNASPASPLATWLSYKANIIVEIMGRHWVTHVGVMERLGIISKIKGGCF